MTDLQGRHALVTGGGSGIGLAIAQALRGAGAEVTITGRREDVLRQAAERIGAHAQVMDVTDEHSVVEGTRSAVQARGPVRICIANAGIAEGRAIPKTDMEFWRRIMSTNLDGAFVTVREALRSMQGESDDWGRVIAISSIAGIRGLRGAGAYTASKHGVIGLIRALSEDHLGRGITFNAICPGYVETDIITRNVASIRERAGVSADEALGLMVEANRHKRLIGAEEVASAALWLCGNGAGSVNGQTIEIAGGQA
ncbi:SDR family NAD(P)-dependent oxidoreductase [Profundibacterium mesophilum]|uniref:3-oxoacyl-acyl-carrier protein reductase n=1 Tax=Profundibacterium mesophilum KAUST100406-0324 TaxID=1037889 RepID=A0A921TB67_9RHOB|nr:SDR family NAD(P)-dependent oxidoreductase [Profundibacterium mesophilum]KAF0674985.1 3-oxoacyl-acyl-carrier protein reductase [Profundibacterium mesophilum KAUST100406-0324]